MATSSFDPLRQRAQLCREASFKTDFYAMPQAVQEALFGIAAELEEQADEADAQARLASHFADQLVDLWHDDEHSRLSLAAWMGLSDDAYSAWVECRWRDVETAADGLR